MVIEIETWNIHKLFKSTRHAELCYFVYNMDDKLTIKNRYLNDISFETIISLFGHLPLITQEEFSSEIIKYEKEIRL